MHESFRAHAAACANADRIRRRHGQRIACSRRAGLRGMKAVPVKAELAGRYLMCSMFPAIRQSDS